MTSSALVLFAAIMVLLTRPVGYAVQSPGPTIDTLGELGGHQLITSQEELYPAEGKLMLTTVITAGGPGFPVYAGQVIGGWADSAVTVVPSQAVFTPGLTQDQISDQGQQMMISSQTNATVAALEELGFEVPADLIIVGATEQSSAHGQVQEGDIATALVGDSLGHWSISSYADLLGKLREIPPATDLVLEVLRDGATEQLPLTTLDSGQGGSLLGIYLDPTFEYPIDIEIFIENVGGPSAGLMFALGIIESLTPEDLAGGAQIAGTGTMSLDGMVGPIGGVVQKMNGAVRDGADFFFIPPGNCAEAVNQIPGDLRVIPVETLADGHEYLREIGAGNADSLPHCPAVP